jgi:hypothetical protein
VAIEERGRRAAQEAGLFTLPDGPPGQRVWSFWCLETGRWCLDYHMATYTWTAGREHGRCQSWKEAVRKAAARKPRQGVPACARGCRRARYEVA